MRFRHAFSILGVIAGLPSAAAAQESDTTYGAAGYDSAPATDIYVEGHASLTFLSDQDVDGALSGDVTSDLGFGGALTVGYHLFDNVRVEIEGSLDANDVDDARPITQAAPQVQNPGGVGDTITLGVFGNGLYDIDTGTAFTPYVGGGLGFLRIDAEYGAFGLNDKDHVPAYQWMVGVSWNVTRQTAVTLGYRYRAAIEDPEFGAPAGSIETDYVNHGPELGLRYRF
jgi:opacity protein-like surface antigen